MLSLRELQRGMRAVLLDGADAPEAALVLEAIDGAGDLAAARLDVHRNNVFVSLTDALAATFPVVVRLVDRRFFAYAAHGFIQAKPPARPALAEYGRHFPDFLAAFPPCRELVYLPDVARLEWLLHEAALAPRAAALGADALRSVPPAATRHLAVRLSPSIRYLASRWPVDRIWRANRRGASADEGIGLAGGAAHLEIRRAAGDVEMRPLPPDVFAFRTALSRGVTLAAATEAGLASARDFDLAAALAALFGDGAVAGVALAPEAEP